MIRVDLSRDPERNWDVTFVDEQGESQVVEIRYALLDLDAVAGYRREQMELALSSAGMREDDPNPAARQAFLQAVVDRLQPEQLAQRRGVLAERLRGWGLCDAQGSPLPMDSVTVSAVLRRPDLFAPLWDGLLEASEGAGKKSGKSGSAGGQTTASRG